MGRYEILSVLGRGGVGVVYKARHTHMDKFVAIKTLLDSVVSTDAESFQRFEREARTASNLDHTNIIRIFDFGKTESGLVFLVMEYLGERTLETLLNENGRLDVEQFYSIALQICDGLQNAHKYQVVHRDIKPSNIMLLKGNDGEECVKIVDFGLAKLSSREAAQSLTQTGAIIGTPLFMSPEQCRGLVLDHRSDIYSLGCVFYLTLTGRVPIQGATALDTLFQHTILKPKSFAEAGAGFLYPQALEDVIFKALEKEPDMRHQSMLEFRTEIQKAVFESSFRPGGTAAAFAAPVRPQAQIVTAEDSGSPGYANKVDLTRTVVSISKSPESKRQSRVPEVIASVVVLIAVAIAAYALLNKTEPVSVVEKKYFFPTKTESASSEVVSSFKPVSTPDAKRVAVEHKAEKVVKTHQPKADKKSVEAVATPKPAATVVMKTVNDKAEHEQLAGLFAEARVQLAQKDWVAAQKSYDECSRLQAKMFGARNYRLFPTLSTLMHCQMVRSDVANTRPNLMVALDVFTREQSAVLQDVSAKPQAAKIWRNMAVVCRANGVPTRDLTFLKWSADFYELARKAWSDKGEQEYRQMCKDYAHVLELCGNRERAGQVLADIGQLPAPDPAPLVEKSGKTSNVFRNSVQRNGRMVIRTYR